MNIPVNDVNQDVEAILGVLFAAMNQFRNALMGRLKKFRLENEPKLYDSEKLLLTAIDIEIW